MHSESPTPRHALPARRGGQVTVGDVAIVIPVRDDPLIDRCIESAEAGCRIVVAANGSTSQFLDRLASRYGDRIRLVSIAEAGIGAALNAGITHSERDWVLLMDSDCVFLPGSIQALLSAAATHDIVKGRVEFQYDNASSRVAALGRRYLEDPTWTGKVSAYSPPLLYRRVVVDLFGGYHFDPRMTWREDRDFELRRRAAGVPVEYAPAAVIRHKRITVGEDLKSVRAYGMGQARGEQLKLLPPMTIMHEFAKVARVFSRICRQGRPHIAVYAVGRYVVLWVERYRCLRDGRRM